VRGETAGGPGARGEVAGAPPPPTESPQAQADRKRRELEAAEEARCKHIKEKVERGVWRAEYWKWLVPELVSKDGGPKLLYMYQQFPMMAAAAGRLLSAHVTSCATERNWSQFGSIFTKTKNRLALKRAHKIAYVRSNNSKGATRADEEVMLSVADVADEEEGEEEQVMEMDE